MPELSPRSPGSKPLRECEDWLLALVEEAPDALVVVDPQGTIVFCNRRIESLLGYAQGELVGREVECLLPARLREAHIPLREAFTRAPTLRPMGSGADLFARAKDGHEVPVSIGLSPVQTSQGLHIMAALRDVSEEVATRATLAAQAEELERSNADLEQFAYVASHDLQEPLRMVISYVQLIEKRYSELLDEKGQRFMGYAVDGAKRMRELINDLLAYSRAGRPGQAPAPVDCGQLVRDTRRALARRLAEVDGELSVEGELPTVHGHRTLLGQVFQNLIENGLKFRGAEPPRVSVSAQPEGTMWRFRVRDNGIGIEPRHQERVFQVFQRLHGHGEYPGTGIGLAVVRKIVDVHGGTVSVVSEPGAGTEFSFTLPQRTETD